MEGSRRLPRTLLAAIAGATVALALAAGDVAAQEDYDVEDLVEAELDNEVEDEFEDEIEDQVESELEDEVEADVEDEVHSELESEIEDLEFESEDEGEEELEGGLDDEDDNDGSSDGDDAAMGALAAVERALEVDVDRAGHRIVRGEWLALVAPSDLERFQERGLVVAEVRALPALGLVAVRIESPAAPDPGLTGGAVDFNHLYAPQQSGQAAQETGWRPTDALDTAGLGGGEEIAIGMIDSDIDATHPALAASHVSERDFVSYGRDRPQAHGTAVASILVGKSDAYRGLLPDARLFAASVFFNAPDGTQSATTLSLVQALDWLVRSGVTTVNVSLSGPDNAVLHAAVRRARDLGVLVVAAVGNEGPAAPPLFPAAYTEAVAVTAVARNRRPYRLSCRGAHVDFAAPGVSILHARPRGGYGVSSGTSIAAPFVTALVAAGRARGEPQAVLDALRRASEDLGDPGRDDTFGHGLIRAPSAR